MQSWKRSACDRSTTARHGSNYVQKQVCATSEVGSARHGLHNPGNLDEFLR